MKYTSTVNWTFLTGLLLLVLGAVTCYSDLSSRRAGGEQAVEPSVAGEFDSQTIDRTREEVIAEMKTLGALGREFSEWYAAPHGKAAGAGTGEAPWDLATALAGGPDGKRVKPGDIIWLRAGRYTGSFTSRIQGAPDRPVHIRQYPGERAILDKNGALRETGTLNVRGANVWFWDFEVTNSFAGRARLDPAGELNPWRGSGINVWAPNTRYINLVIYDNGHGFGLWNEEGGTEIYGCVLFNNGNNKKEHGIYGHNKTGIHYIRDNIIFNGAGYGLHLYANSTKSSVSGFEIEGNAVFNNGTLTLDDQVADQILVGGVEGVPAERVTVRANYIYNEPEAPTSKNRGIRLGYEDMGNKDVRILDNYIVSKVPLRVLWWQSVEARGNTIYSAGKNVEVVLPQGTPATGYRWESNSYLGENSKGPIFTINERKISFASWQTEQGFDRNARLLPFVSPEAAVNSVFIRPNKYERGRATIIIYNWKNEDQVTVSLEGLFKPQEAFVIRDAQNFLGEPVLQGFYNGKPIRLPLNLKKTVPPVGNVERVPVHTTARFGVFVVQKKNNPPERGGKISD